MIALIDEYISGCPGSSEDVLTVRFASLIAR